MIIARGWEPKVIIRHPKIGINKRKGGGGAAAFKRGLSSIEAVGVKEEGRRVHPLVLSCSNEALTGRQERGDGVDLIFKAVCIYLPY